MISVGAEVLSTLHLALLMGYGLPSILMCLPAPSWIAYDTKQIFLFAWQLFPFLVGMTHATGVRTTRELQSPAANYSLVKTIAHRRVETLHGLQSIYTLAITVAGFTHWLTILLVLFNRPLSGILPSVLVASDPDAVFTLWPAIPNFTHLGKIPQVADIAEGFLVLLQYDTLFAGLGVLVWATWLNCRVDQRGESWKAIVSAFIHTAICGPCGAAVYQMWGRDGWVFKDWALGRKEE